MSISRCNCLRLAFSAMARLRPKNPYLLNQLATTTACQEYVTQDGNARHVQAPSLRVYHLHLNILDPVTDAKLIV